MHFASHKKWSAYDLMMSRQVPENLPEAPSLLAISPDRLGHATLLDDACRKHIYDHKIPIEICMTSNVLSKTVPTYEEHHLKELLANGQPFCISVSIIRYRSIFCSTM